MEKWKSRVKETRTESVLPPTRRACGQSCKPVDKKKDRKWSLGGLFRRISSGQNNDVSSNDEDITYIPGHMLSERSIKKSSKMKSKLEKFHRRSSNDGRTAESTKEICPTVRESESKIISTVCAERPTSSPCACDDSMNSRSSEGSPDATGKNGRINRTKVRAQVERSRFRGNSSSDDDSHVSCQSLGQLRTDDGNGNLRRLQKIDASNRKTRGARTQRYKKRMYRDDGTSGSDGKTVKSNVSSLPKDSITSKFSSYSIDSSKWRDSNAPTSLCQAASSPNRIYSNSRVSDVDSSTIELSNDVGKFDRCTQDEKIIWPRKNFSSVNNEIYGSLRQRRVVPPEPPLRTSKSRVFTNVLNNVNNAVTDVNSDVRSSRRYIAPNETKNFRSYNSDNDVSLSDYVAPLRLRHMWQNSEPTENYSTNDRFAKFRESRSVQNGDCNSLERNCNNGFTETVDYHEERENNDPRPCFTKVTSPRIDSTTRSTSSLPKGVQLFARQRFNNGDDDDVDRVVYRSKNFIHEIPNDRSTIEKFRETKNSSNLRSSPTSSFVLTRNIVDDEAERKRSSKNLEDALTELEAIYKSLRLSDDDLLERAEQRSMAEYHDNAAKTANEVPRTTSTFKNVATNDESVKKSSRPWENDSRIKDDMAYRRMNPKERPGSVNGQISLSQISYLTTSPNLSQRNNDDDCDRGKRRVTPDLTRDDLLFRSITRANNTPKVIEPQPPFGIPLGPVTAATESDYLHMRPAKFEQTRSLYIPKSEPDVLTDDLAFRNLRKDANRDNSTNSCNPNAFVRNDANEGTSFVSKNRINGIARKKRAVRSVSADLRGIVKIDDGQSNDWYNDYIRSTQKLRVLGDDEFFLPIVDNEDSRDCRTNCLGSESLNLGDDSRCKIDEFELDINGNRSKNPLQRKIQVYIAPENRVVDEIDKRSSIGVAKGDVKPKRSTTTTTTTTTNDVSSNRCDSRSSSRSDGGDSTNDKIEAIESFTDQELTEYKQLCRDLEKLLRRTDDAEKIGNNCATTIPRYSEDNNSQSEFDELEKLLKDDCESPIVVPISDDIVEATSSEKTDDPSLDRSIDLGSRTFAKNDFSLSPTIGDEKFANDDATSASDMMIGSSATGSFDDGVCEKFDEKIEIIDKDDERCENSKKSTDELEIVDRSDDDCSKYPVDEIFSTSTTTVDRDNSTIVDAAIVAKSSDVESFGLIDECAIDGSSPSRKMDDRGNADVTTDENLIGTVEKPAYRQG